MSRTIADENISQNPSISPGIVESLEILLRLGFHPEHMEDGKIGPRAVSLSDLRQKGFSVDREAYVKRQVLQDRAHNQMANRPDDRKEPLISSFSCSDVRVLIGGDSRRAFIVLDDALPENTAHASIYSAFSRTDSQLRQIRALLLTLLQNYMPLKTYLRENPNL